MAFCTNCGKELLGNFEFCPECGKKIENNTHNTEGTQTFSNDYHGKTKICPNCGEKMPDDAFYCLACGYTFPDQDISFETAQKTINMKSGVWKNKRVALLLCIFLGWLGIHRFYEGKVVTGLIYLFTFGIFGVGWIIDIILIALKPNPYRVK